MKIIAYATRKDELESFDLLSKEYGHTITVEKDSFGLETAHLAKGHDAISIIGNCDCSRIPLEKIASYGIKYISIRAAGFDNVDLEACKDLGIKVTNVPAYSPSSVSEFVIGMALNLTRNIPTALDRVSKQDFSLQGLIGREIQDLTVGVVGTGRIGAKVARAFAGFGGKVIVNDLYENDEVKKFAQYKSLDDLLSEADIITLHCPLMDDNYHMINESTIKNMKDDVIIINAARGGLVDTEALIDGIKSGKIKGVAIDTYEHEAGIFFKDHSGSIIQDDSLARLMQFPNVLITPHYAFYTETAVKNIIETAFDNLKKLENEEVCGNELTAQ